MFINTNNFESGFYNKRISRYADKANMRDFNTYLAFPKYNF